MSKLVFFGTEDFSLPFLEALVEDGHEVAGVVTKPDSPRGRSARPVKPAVKRLAEEKFIPVIQPRKLSKSAREITKLGAQAGLLAAYGRIIPDELLGPFPAGIVNVHPSDLPRHRGPSPIEQTILDGDEKTAVSLIKLTSTMDAGPVYAKARLDVKKDMSKQELTKQLIEAGVRLVKDKMPAILDGSLKPKPQDDSKATYTKLIRKSDGKIDWSLPAVQIERQIRAYMGWPGSFTKLFDVRVTILEASVADLEGNPGEHFVSDEGDLCVYCGSGALTVHKIQPAGKKPMSSADFLRGYSG